MNPRARMNTQSNDSRIMGATPEPRNRLSTVARGAASVPWGIWLLVLGLGLIMAACSGASSGSTAVEGTKVAINVTAEDPLDKINYTISGPGGVKREGSVDVAASTEAAFVLGGLPAGGPYSIAVSAQEGGLTCTGSGQFFVESGATTKVALKISCRTRPTTGSARIDGEINVCPNVDAPSALPAEVVVGGKITLIAGANDPDAGPSPLVFNWSAPAGTFEDATLPSTTYTCAHAGVFELTLAISDGDPACDSTVTIEVKCSPVSARMQTAPNDPLIATITTSEGLLSISGQKGEDGVATAIRTISGTVPGEPPVTVFVDASGQMAGFATDQIFVAFDRDANGSRVARVSGEGFNTYEVTLPVPDSTATAEPQKASYAAMTLMEAGSAAMTTPAESALRSELAPAVGPTTRTVAVQVQRCGVAENHATVVVQTAAATGLQTSAVAQRVGDGYYSVQLQLPPDDGAPTLTSTLADICEGFAKITDVTCPLLQATSPAFEGSICPALAVLAGVAGPAVLSACLGAFELARLFCMYASPEWTPPNSDSLPDFICDQIAGAASTVQNYPLDVWASARAVGLSNLAVSGRYRLSQSTAALPVLQIEIQEGCSSPPPTPGCTYSVQPTEISLSVAGGGSSIAITTSAADCTWQGAADDAWVTLSPSGGTGTASVLVRAGLNSGAARTTAITIAGQRVTVRQAGTTWLPPPGSDCSGLTVEPSSASYGERGGKGSFTVRALPSCNWLTTTDSLWITITSGSSGTGDGVVEYLVAANTWPTGRVANVAVADRVHSVTQASPSLTCRYGLDHISKTFSSAGGSDSVLISANSGLCGILEPHPSDPWISVGTPARTKVLGEWTAAYTVGPNSNTQPRDGYITLMDALLNIHQDGLACSFNLEPAVVSVPASGGNAVFTLKATRPDCQWEIVLGNPDVHVAGSSSGSGSAVLELIVAPNATFTNRSFAINVAGAAARIDQAAPPIFSHTLTINVQGDGTVAVSGGTSALCTGPTCVYDYEMGTPIALTAQSGQFLGWEQDCSGANAACSLTMNANHSVTARFADGAAGLTINIQGPGAIFAQPPRILLQPGNNTVQVADGTTLQLVAAGQLQAWGGACAGIGASTCTFTVHGSTRVTAQFAFRADVPQVNGTVRTMQFGALQPGQVQQTVERWYPPYNLRFSFLSQQQRNAWLQATDANPPTELGGFSMPYGNYFTWPAVRNGQNVMYQFSPPASLAQSSQQLVVPLYWWYDGISTENVIMLTGTVVP